MAREFFKIHRLYISESALKYIRWAPSAKSKIIIEFEIVNLFA